MKIYSVSGTLTSGGCAVQHWHFEPTLIAARLYVARAVIDGSAVAGDLEIDAYEYPSTRKGLADALNHFIDWTCINEG